MSSNKPLTAEQKADAKRLSVRFFGWQDRQKKQGLPYSQGYAAGELGFNQSALSQYINGIIPLNAAAGSRFAKLLGCKVSDFSPTLARHIESLAAAQGMDLTLQRVDGNDNIAHSVHSRGQRAGPTIQITSIIQAGRDGFLEELGLPVDAKESQLPYHGQDPRAYAVQVRGDGMANRIMSGDYVIVEPSTQPKPGDIAVVELRDGRKTVRLVLFERDNEVRLAGFNHNTDPLLLSAVEIYAMHKVVGIIPR